MRKMGNSINGGGTELMVHNLNIFFDRQFYEKTFVDPKFRRNSSIELITTPKKLLDPISSNNLLVLLGYYYLARPVIIKKCGP